MLDEYLAVSADHTFVRHDQYRETVYYDISNDRELTVRNGKPIKAKRITPQRSQLVLDCALQGKKGFNFETLSEENFTMFEELFTALAH